MATSPAKRANDSNPDASRATASRHDVFREGLDAAAQGRFSHAVEEFSRYLKACTAANDRVGVGRAYRNLGVAFIELKQPKRAKELLEQGLVIARETADKKAEVKCLQSIGVAQHALGLHNAAIRTLEEAQTAAKSAGAKKCEGVAVENLAVLKSELGSYKQAVALHERAISIAQDVGDEVGCAVAQENLDRTNEQWHKYNRARQQSPVY